MTESKTLKTFNDCSLNLLNIAHFVSVGHVHEQGIKNTGNLYRVFNEHKHKFIIFMLILHAQLVLFCLGEHQNISLFLARFVCR